MVKLKKKKTVFVGMSGGVDSAVSAAILQKQGYDVVGVFIRTWHPEFLVCNEEEERRDAMRVCAHLDIPFLTFDFEDVYKKEVADYMISEYKAGRTPNPDVMCNKEVKFGAFLEKALAMGADYVATGHYAKIKHIQNFEHGRFQPKAGVKWKNYEYVLLEQKDSKNSSAFLHPAGGPFRLKNSLNLFSLEKGIDPSKDQAYFLWTLNQKQLSKILFPIGHLKKTEVRKLAKKFKLPVAEKKDSQGICFLGAVDLKDFLKHYIKEKKGKVIDDNGNEIGFHNGVVFHTLGERHGFTITKKSPKDEAYYVVGKDVKKNILYVSQGKNISLIRANRRIVLNDANWISKIPKSSKIYQAQIRYHGEFLPCKIKITAKTRAEIMFQKPTLVASGQSVVIYDKDICLGGGVVK